MTPMTTTLTIDDLDTVVDHGSVVAITGTAEDGRRVTFGSDARAIEPALAALIADLEDEVVVQIEAWQILGRTV